MISACVKMLLLLLMPVYSLGQLVVTNLQERILYIGVNNYIDYAVKTTYTAEVTLTVSRGELITDFGKLVYRHCRYEPGVITFYAINKRSKKIIDSVLFRLKPLPDPRIKLIAINMNEGVYLGNNMLRDLTGVIGYLSGDYEAPIKIVEYEVVIAKRSGQKIMVTNKDSRPSQELKDELLKLQDDDIVTIRNFKVHFGCETPDRLVRESFVYKISHGKAILDRGR